MDHTEVQQPTGVKAGSYSARLSAERDTYHDCVNVHHLPDIFHYWSNRHIRPKVEEFGFSGPNDMFRKYLREQCERRDGGPKRFVSIGSGNCDLETQLALDIRAMGYSDFTIDCLDLNAAMLQRGQAAAAKAGTSNLNFVQADVNEWTAAHEYDAVIANQTLHHVLKLEHLFAQIKSCLKPAGCFVISDMIGRNGHQRWPEALAIVHEFWRTLPPSYRFNRALQRYEELYEDCDCSGEGFEGIRAQDILPLLLEYFHFQLFVGFGNVIDPFVDRSFGFNFDATASRDRDFIDDVNRRDEEEIFSGHLKPTHMLAAVGNNSAIPTVCPGRLTPEFCLRDPSLVAGNTPSHLADAEALDAYDWQAWPPNTQAELEVACRRLKEYGGRVKVQATHVQRLEYELEQRTAWARRLEKDCEERTTWAIQLAKEFEERTAWALQLDVELAERAAQASQLSEEIERLNGEIEERTAWALQLNRELEDRKVQVSQLTQVLEQLAWARAIDRRFHHYLFFAFQIVRRTRNRLKRLPSREETQ